MEMLESRQISRQVRSATVGPVGFFQSIAIGMDNRTLLPPFIPMLRGEDMVYSSVLSACEPEGLLGYLPCSVLHSPLEVRHSPVANLSKWLSSFQYFRFLSWLIARQEGPPSSSEKGYDRLGNYLISVGSLSDPEYSKLLADAYRTQLSRSLSKWRSLLAKADPAAFFGADLASAVAIAEELLNRESAWIPTDLIAQGEIPHDAITRAKRITVSYGELLRKWPTIIASARELRVRGTQLGTVLTE